jgi:hypothetical protein
MRGAKPGNSEGKAVRGLHQLSGSPGDDRKAALSPADCLMTTSESGPSEAMISALAYLCRMRPPGPDNILREPGISPPARGVLRRTPKRRTQRSQFRAINGPASARAALLIAVERSVICASGLRSGRAPRRGPSRDHDAPPLFGAPRLGRRLTRDGVRAGKGVAAKRRDAARNV